MGHNPGRIVVSQNGKMLWFEAGKVVSEPAQIYNYVGNKPISRDAGHWALIMNRAVERVVTDLSCIITLQRKWEKEHGIFPR